MSKEGDTGWLTSVYRFLRSVKLAVVLLLLLTGASILATLVPQGKDVRLALWRPTPTEPL